MRTLVWFRGKDLRVADHPPLQDAAARGEVLPLFVLDPYFFAPERARHAPHRIQFLLEAIADLDTALRRRGSRLILAVGKSVDVVPQLAHEWRVDRVVGQRWCAPFARERDRRVALALHVPFTLFDGETLHHLGSLRSATGQPYAVFSAFARAFTKTYEAREPLAAPERLPAIPPDVTAPEHPLPSLESLGIAHNPRILPGGESHGLLRLERFLKGTASRYDRERDRLDLDATSRLSADLKFGTLSVRSVWGRVAHALAKTAAPALAAFSNELVWREFAHALLWEHPELLEQPFRREWQGFPWRNSESDWQAWQDGRTGYPVVDAAARQLLAEGFVHNRARMIAASFLTKQLLLDYRLGEAHYLRLLTDGDWAQNDAAWQWCAGCGSDAQPYFRVFNPTLQAQKFDPTGDYVRRWVPELARLAVPHLHTPSVAPAAVLEAAGVRLGSDYPSPIIEHRAGRERFLAVAQAHLERARNSA